MGVSAIAALVLVAPAMGASDTGARTPPKRAAAAARALSGFTPAAADPRLAAVFARGGLDGTFRFTPSEARRSTKSVTVAVRARTNRSDVVEQLAVAAPTVGVAPIAYNLGAAVGWRRFAVSGDISKVDLGAMPGGRESANVALTYAGDRFSGQLRASDDRPVAGTPRLVEGAQSYSLDAGGSYRLTRNLDVTAGVRYKSERDRLVRVADDRRDSQAVYVGTAFRF